MKQTRIILLFAALLALCSCSTTKRIPEGEQLYTGVKKFTIITPDSTGKVVPGFDASLRKQVAVAPNNAIFGSPYYRWPFPMGLWVWNNWNDPATGSSTGSTTSWWPSLSSSTTCALPPA